MTDYSIFTVEVPIPDIGNMVSNRIGGLNGGLNDSEETYIDKLYQIIQNSEGKNTKNLSKILQKPYKTVEKWLIKLKNKNQIIFRGSKKTGGYFILK